MKEKGKYRQKIMKYILVSIISFVFFSHFIALGYSNTTGVFDGMYVNYIHSDSFHIFETQEANIEFSRVSDDVYHVIWFLGEGTLGTPAEQGSWDEELSSRIVSNTDLPSPVAGSHTWTRILTNISLNDIVQIFIYSGGDQNFNVTAELNWTMPGYGQIEVWKLEDSNGSAVWYEKSTGIFLNGTFQYSGFWKKAIFVSTNALTGPLISGIPGYSILILVGTLSIVIFLIGKKLKKSNT
ncbi:MAG: hypothetical protein ACFFEY_18005 [Candidatus Thorarchaeota archaeon]